MLFIQNITELYKNLLKANQFGENESAPMENPEVSSDNTTSMNEVPIYDPTATKKCMKENDARELWDKRDENIMLQWEEDTDDDGCIDKIGTRSDTNGDGILTSEDADETIVEYN